MARHHELGASRHSAWDQCLCWEGKPAGEAAERGTLQHTLLERLLKSALDSGIDDAKKHLTSEEIDAVNWAYQEIKLNATGDILSEIELSYYANPDDFDPLFFSTLDACATTSKGNGVDIWDYKSGEPHNYMPQMRAYAAAACQAYKKDYANVRLLYGRTKSVDARRFDRVEAERETKALIEKRLNPFKQPTPCSYCSWCKHAAACPALNNAAQLVVAGREDWKLETFHASEIAKPEEMSKALTLAQHLSEWCAAVQHHAKEMAIKRGLSIPGYELIIRNVRELKDVAKVFAASALSAEDFIACCSVKVGDLEKKLGKKAFNAQLCDLVSFKEQKFLTATKA